MDMLKQFGLNCDFSSVNISNYADEARVEVKKRPSPDNSLNSYFGRLQLQTSEFDCDSEELRNKVMDSFDTIQLAIMDTRCMVNAKAFIKDNKLMLKLPTINNLCSKMHIEDVSPISDEKLCNHDKINCKDEHFHDSSLLVNSIDYLQCEQSDAIFMSSKSKLYFKRNTKWILVKDEDVQLNNGYYTLKSENF